MWEWVIGQLLVVGTSADHRPYSLATTPEAEKLYTGCPSRYQASRRTVLIVVGVEMGGTTEFEEEAKDHVCEPVEPMESQYFAAKTFFTSDPTPSSILRYEAQWSECKPLAITAESSPGYFNLPSAARATCLLFPQPLIVVLLRNPIDRAYSSFYQPPFVVPVDRNRNGFDKLATVEMDIVSKCPGALPMVAFYNDNGYDDFRRCCGRVARAHHVLPWPGCGCLRSGKTGEECPPWGHTHASQIRIGVYVHFLKFWLTYHHGDHVLVAKSETFFEDAAGATAAIIDVAAKMAGLESVFNQTANSRRDLVQTTNRAAPKKKHPKEPMLNHTRRNLEGFYAPYNEELAHLLGHPTPWW